MSAPETRKLPVVALISGRGSNLQAIIDAMQRGTLPIELRAVISNRPEAQGLARARAAGIPAEVVDHTAYPDREAFDRALAERIAAHAPGLIVLAGFMRILGEAFLERFAGRLLNIHPSLLPALRGLHTHARALAEGLTEHGASVHFVTNELDSGPVILQAKVAVHPGDDAQTLAARVLEQEHRIYPLAVRWVAEGRVRLGADGRVVLDGRPLARPPVLRPGADEPELA